MDRATPRPGHHRKLFNGVSTNVEPAATYPTMFEAHVVEDVPEESLVESPEEFDRCR